MKLVIRFILSRELKRVVLCLNLYGLCLKKPNKSNGRTRNQMEK